MDVTPAQNVGPEGIEATRGGFKERQTLYGGGGIECPLYRDGGAIGVSGDMRPGNPEVVGAVRDHQRLAALS
jgi:hypothetical protein